jgi:DNA-binding response OmpR family regulator
MMAVLHLIQGIPMKKILVIDDDAALREVMKTVLSGSYEVKEAGTKTEGLSVLAKFRPDLVILDVMMESVKAGFEAAREIRVNKKFKNVKILMITNVDKEMHIDYKSEAGDADWLPVDGYLQKPVEPKTLLARVRQLL